MEGTWAFRTPPGIAQWWRRIGAPADSVSWWNIPYQYHCGEKKTHVYFKSIWFSDIRLSTFVSDWAAFRNLLINTYGVGTEKLNCNVFTINLSYGQGNCQLLYNKGRKRKKWQLLKDITISRTSFLVYALSDTRTRSSTRGTETSSYLQANSIAVTPTNWRFFLTTVWRSKNLSIRLTVRNNVSSISSNL